MTSVLCASCQVASSTPVAQTHATAPARTAETRDSPAAKAIQSYLQARVERNANKAVALSCADWEKRARVEVDSLRSDAKLEGLVCHEAGASGAFTLVACSGKILTSYSGETRELDLSQRQFRAAFQAGEWLMCGYQ